MIEVRESYHDGVRWDVFDMVPTHAGHLLDLGGGIGATGAALKAAGRASTITLVDQVADKVVADVDKAFVGDLEDVSLIDHVLMEAGPFDTILCLDVLEHLRDPWTVVKSLHKSLTPNGTLIISVPNVNYIGLLAPLVLKGRFDLTDEGILDRTHLRWFAKHGLIELATISGLSFDRIKPIINSKNKKLFDTVTMGILSRFLALQYVVRVINKRSIV